MVQELFSPKGSQYFPTKTCADLAREYDMKEDGYYFIDPNGGHWRDSVKVLCRFAQQETCIDSTTEQFQKGFWFTSLNREQKKLLDTNEGLWFNHIAKRQKFAYQIEPEQLLYLQVSSESALQEITFDCQNLPLISEEVLPVSSRENESLALLGDDDLTITNNNNSYSLFRYSVLKNGCGNKLTSSSEWGQAKVQVDVPRPRRLPIRDVKLMRAPLRAGLGIRIGQVCFRGVMGPEIALPTMAPLAFTTGGATIDDLSTSAAAAAAAIATSQTPGSNTGLIDGIISSTVSWLSGDQSRGT